MFICNDCQFSGLIDNYCKHVKSWHPKKEYVCGQNGCIRTFSAVQYLKRHLKSNHSDNETNILENLEGPCVQPKLVPDNATSQIETTMEVDPSIADVESNLFLIPEDTATIETIEKDYKIFVLSLFSNPSVSRKIASFVADNVSKTVSSILKTLQFKLLELVDTPKKKEVDEIFSDFLAIFKIAMTENNTKAYLRNNNCYKDPISVTIDEEIADTMQHGKLVLGKKKSTVVKVDIPFLFKSFFELPGIFEECFKYMNDLKANSTNIISNVIQGSSWKNRYSDMDSMLTIPFCLYHDDFEPGNTLGANCGVQSLSSFFIHFPTLPPHVSNLLENIFPILCCKTRQKKYGLNKILHSMVMDFCKIEEDGIVLNINGNSTTVYFSLCLLLGDNKALNELGGFTTCFIKSGYCRICSCTADEAKYLEKEDETKIRTIENYNTDLDKNDFNVTGIKEECFFNNIPSFHAIDSPSADIMHDIFEGVCHFQMTKIILNFIESKLFTLDDLNNRVSLFDFGFYEVGNLPVDIQMSHLKSGKLKMSASESICFCLHFSLIIGDLVPPENEVWELYTVFLQLLNLLLQNSFSPEDIQIVQDLTEKNHRMYKQLFETHLKPKHHFMLHYGELIRKIGPLTKMCVLKQEMYHRELKRYINQSYNRRNLALSVQLKESLKFACRLIERRGLSESLFTKIIFKKKVNLNTLKFSREIKNLLKNQPDTFSDFGIITEVYFKNVLYKPASVIFDMCNDSIAMYKVIYILQLPNKTFQLFATKLNIVRFDNHLLSYIIKISDIKKLFDFNCLEYFPQCIHKICTGELAVRTPKKF